MNHNEAVSFIWSVADLLLFDAVSDLAALASEQGVEPIDDPDRLVADFWPIDESADEFLAAVYSWRSEDHAA